MTRLTIRTLAVVLLLALATASHAGQQTAPPPQQKPEGTNVPLRINIVIARYRGDKRVSSLPYTLFAQVQNRERSVAQLRMGAEIPVATAPPPKPNEGAASEGPRVNYERLGTEIDCLVRPSLDGRYIVDLTISDKTVYSEDEAPRLTSAGMMPTLRSFRAYNQLVMRDGQTVQFPAAADRVTGEVVRIEIALESVK